MNNDEIEFVLKCFKKYVSVMEDLGSKGITTADIDHSALLHRLLEGKPMLEKAPPKCFSYPCYDLGEGKPVRIIDIHGPYDDAEYGLVIEQSKNWKWIDQAIGILQHKNGDFFKLTLTHGDIGGGGILQKCDPP